MTTPDEDVPASVRGTGLGRDVVLVVGLVGIGIGGLVAFVKAAPESGAGLPVSPIAALVVLLLGAVLVKWTVAPGRRRVPRRRGSRGRRPAAALDGSAAPGTAAPGTAAPGTAAPTTELPDVGSGALDHAGADADGFEHTVAALCARDGCTSVEVVGGAGDLGADVLATTADGRRVVLQCKHYSEDNRVGSQDLQRFGGTCFAVHQADVAVLVTTGSLTAPAVEYAETCGIVCVDGEVLAAWTEMEAPPPWEAGGPEPGANASA